jgi:Flp pilus assembly protein TadD
MSQPDRTAGIGLEGAGDTVESCYAAGLWTLDRGDTDGARYWLARCNAAPGGTADARCAALGGAIATEEGDFDGAVEHFRRATRLAPDDPALARQLGEVLSASGRLDEAAGVLDEAARRQPDDADTLVDLGYVRMLAGDGAGARQALERAAQLRPDDPAIGRALGQVYEAAGDPAAAAAALAAGGDLSPRAANDLARLYLQLERYADAEGVFRRLGQLAADDQPGAQQGLAADDRLVAQHGLVWCRIKQGDWRGAFDLALSATRLDRYGLTTDFLAYARDRLFGRAPDAAAREAELGERFAAEMREHYELHEETEAAVAAVGGAGEGE